MQDSEKNGSFKHLLVLAGLWLINILIVIFGLPFLIFKKLQELFSGKKIITAPLLKPETESNAFLPPQIDSKP